MPTGWSRDGKKCASGLSRRDRPCIAIISVEIRETIMQQDEFWRLIEETRPLPWKCFEHAAALTQKLVPLDIGEIVAFHTHFCIAMIQLDRAPVWAIAGMVLGLVSDDTFKYFRGWAVLQGRAVVEELQAPTDKVSRYFPPYGDCCCEGALAIAPNAYEEKTGEWDIPTGVLPQRIDDQMWSEGEVEARLPAMCKLFKMNYWHSLPS
jgi:hypothetical protein